MRSVLHRLRGHPAQLSVSGYAADRSSGQRGAQKASRQQVPGGSLLQPAALLAVAVLVLNDHWLKGRFGNAGTGKLSDLVGVFFFPLLLVSLLEIGRKAWGTEDWAWRRQELLTAMAVTAGGLAAIKVVPIAGHAYVHGMGGAQWIVASVGGAVTGDGVATYHTVQLVRDPTDLLVLPVLGLTYVLALRSRQSAGRAGGGRARVGWPTSGASRDWR